MKTLRETLITTMYEAIYKHGYHATNLNDVLNAAGTSKGGMYHYFDSKQSLALIAIEEVVGAYIHECWELPLSQSENPLQTLFDILKAMADPKKMERFGIEFQYGCPLNNFIQELQTTNGAFATLLRTLFARWEQAIAHALTRIKKELKIDVNIAQAASFTVASIEGSFTYAKVYGGEKSFRHMMDQLIVFISSLIR